MSILNSLSGAVLRKAASIKDKIETLEVEFAKLVKASSVGFSVTLGNIEAKSEKPAKKNKGMSAAGRAKIAAAQKARWAKLKGGKKASVKTFASAIGKGKTAAKKTKMSPAARAKIAAAQKARWAKINAAKAASK